MTRCLMLDVDGVVIKGRPEDGRPWATSLEADLGIAPAKLQEVFFAPHWPDIVTGRKDLLEVLQSCMPLMSPSVTPEEFITYWFEKDSHIDASVLTQCATLRAEGMQVFLASNQEHMRARHIMERLGLRDHVDGMIYSAQLGERKPDRAFFDGVATRIGRAPSELVLVDDTEANVDTARNAEWAARHWTEGASLIDLLRGL